jgi:hypothetical protein
VKTLGALEARYADDHVPLALALGAVSALSAVRRLLPDDPRARAPLPTDASADADTLPSSPDAFIALLLGAVATHDRLLVLFGPTLTAHRARGSEAKVGEETYPLEGLLR